MADEFRDYKSDPATDNLIRLLRAHQGRVYRLCFQVLRRAHDAEDAAQEVLLRIVDGVRKIDDADAFRRWVHRVGLNAALEVARKAARRRAHETRAAMKDPPPAPLDEESRQALFKAIAKLDDGPRELILDHHFEGETLESLASRERVSPQAVSKRLERAREELKRALPAGFLGIPDLGRLFEQGATSSIVPDLVTGPVLAKAQAAGAALAAGGILMTAKSSLLVAVAITALICLSTGIGLGVLLKSPADRTEPGRLAEGGRSESIGKDRAPGKGPGVKGPDAPAPPAPDPQETSASKGTLTARLKRYKAFMESWAKEKTSLGSRMYLDQKFQIEYRNRKYLELALELDGIRDLIFADPDAFLEFLRSPENEACLGELTIEAFGFRVHQRGMSYVQHLEFGTFPKILTDGLLDLLRTGSAAQKEAAMNFFGNVEGLPESFAERWTALVEDRDPNTQSRAVRLAAEIRSMTKETLDAMVRVGSSSPHLDVRMAVAQAMQWVEFPAARDYLMDRLEKATEPHEVANVVLALSSKFMAASRGGAAVDEERFVLAATSAMGRALEDGYIKYVISTSLYLPVEKARPLVERARATASTPECRDDFDAILKKIDAGETRREELEKLLWPKR